MGMPADIVAQVAKQVSIDLPGVTPGIGEVEPDEEGGAAEGEEGDVEGEGEGDAEGGEGEGDEQSPGESGEPSGDQEADSGGEASRDEAAEGDGDLAQKLAVIAEAEDEIRLERARLKRREAELSEMAKKVEGQDKSDRDLAAAFKADPFGTMERLGMPFDALLQVVADNQGEIPQGSAPARPESEDEAPAWAKRLEERLDRMEQVGQTEAVTRGENIYKGQISEELKKAEYGALRTMRNAEATIFEIARAHAAQTGELLPVQQIAVSLQEEWKAQLDELPGFDASKAFQTPPLGEKAKAKSQKKPDRQSGEAEPEQTSLSSDMPPSKKPKKKSRGREDDIRNAAASLDANVWGDLDEDDED